ncbi:MAG TPA: hypothetical protein VKW77_06170, partial [Acidimicrobiales bacterium]|nr:hypothetical protein [Acidimicrobiales bacterium]
IWEAAFMAAAQVGRVHPGDWLHVGTVIAAIVGKNAGLAAPAIAGAAGERIWSRGRVAIGASSLVGAIMLLAAAQLVRPVPRIAGLLTAAALAALLIALTGWLRPLRTSKGDGEIDAALGLYCGAEVVVLVVLCRSSSGAWINYGIPAVVFASVLAARSLARAAEARPRGWPVIAALASTAVLASVLMDAKVETSRRRAEHAELARLVAATGLPPSSVFFADRPGLNRMSGRLEWVYDDWLYPAFESLKLAEPRARWLPPAQGPRSEVRALVLEPDGDRLDGLSEPLSALGFRPGGRFGPFRVWTLGSPGRWAP